MTAMKSTESEEISEAEKLLSLLMEVVDKVEIFKGKWALIRPKLATLPTRLNSLSDSRHFSTSSLASELVLSVVQTLSQALTLAEKCSSPNPRDGKLRTQSDLDSVSARLDQHIDDVRVLTRSLNCSGDSESAGSTRCLLTRLQIGSSESRNSAMDSVLNFLDEDDKSVSLAVDEGFVAVLVDSLDSSSAEVREKAVAAISRVTTLDGGGKNPLLSQRPTLIAHLLRALDSRNGFAREKACVALHALSLSSENAGDIGCRSGVASLLEVCRSGTPFSQANAAGVLRNVSSLPETRRLLAEDSDAVEILIATARSGTLVGRGNSIGCLNNLVSEEESLKLTVVREGAARWLKSFWDSAPASSEAAVELLKRLASCRAAAESLVTEGFLPRLEAALGCEAAGVRVAAAEAVGELGSVSSKTRREIGEAGIVPRLVSMLRAKSDGEKETAARALSILVATAANRKIFLDQDEAVDFTVKLLDPSANHVEKKYLVSILASVADSGRRRIVDSGALDHLRRLGDSGVDGAKKLRESLDRNYTTWAVFSRRRK